MALATIPETTEPVELTSGIDALYLSGRGELPGALLQDPMAPSGAVDEVAGYLSSQAAAVAGTGLSIVASQPPSTAEIWNTSRTLAAFR